MQIRTLINADQKAAELFLSGYAESSMFMRSNMARAGLIYNGQPFSGEYWGAFAQNEIIGILAHYWNGNVMMQAPDSDVLDALIDAFQKNMKRPLKGVLGPDVQASTLINALGITQQDFGMNECEGLYALVLDDLLIPECEGSAELATLEKIDSTLILNWMKAYNIEALGAEDNSTFEARIKEEAFSDWALQNRYVLLVEGAPVSLAGCNAKVEDMCQIGPVWTPPEFRGRGYARLVTALLLAQEKLSGKSRAILFTKNPAAEKAYQAIGFKQIGDFRLALLK